jgi:hypothetical protein
MPIHWSYKSLPELSALSDAERKDVWKKATGQVYDQRQTSWVLLAVTVLFVIAGGELGSTFGNFFIGLVIGGVLAGLVSERFVFRSARSNVKKIIAGTGKS